MSGVAARCQCAVPMSGVMCQCHVLYFSVKRQYQVSVSGICQLSVSGIHDRFKSEVLLLGVSIRCQCQMSLSGASVK